MKGNMEKLSVGLREKEKDRGRETAEFRLMAKAFNIQIFQWKIDYSATRNK